MSIQGRSDCFDTEYPFYCLIEVAGSNEDDDSKEAERLLEFIDQIEEHILDGVIPSGEAQSEHIWALRDMISTACV